MTTTPTTSGATAQSSRNDKEISDINVRFQVIEQLLEIDTRFAGLQLPWKSTRTTSQGALDQQETLTAATPAASASLPLSILKATANNVAATLAAPAQDGLWKFIYASDVTHTPSVSGTNVLTESGKIGTFGSLGAFLAMHSLGGKWCIVGFSGVTWA